MKSQRALTSASTEVPNELSFDEQEPFLNGFSRVLKAGNFSFINQTGQLINDFIFQDARNFKNDLAAIKQGEKWGFVNEQGRIAIPAAYDIVFDFQYERTLVAKNGRWLIIDTSGAILHEPYIDACLAFNNGIARIRKGDRKGTMDLFGEIRLGELIKQPSIRHRPGTPQNITSCPDNIDFEFGSLDNWNCFTGSVDSIGPLNVITVSPSAPVVTSHNVISRITPPQVDPYGLFEINPPDGSNYAVKLGNTRIGGEAERIQYVLHVPLNDSNFSVRYDYAVVFQDPGHTPWTQPRFTAKLYDSAANTYISCGSFEYIATSNLPGFAVSSVDSSVIYKPWASAFISLRGLGGKTLYLEFTTADCVRKGHWGYAYLDVQSACSLGIEITNSCESGAATLSGPPGFQTYNWWNENFTTVLGTGETTTIDPAPLNSTIWLELVPFNDFGCQDTIAAHITASFTPHFDASETQGICAPKSFTFYNRNLPSASVTWDFGDGTTGTGDTISHSFTLPGTYIITMNVISPAGCQGFFVDTVSVVNPGGTISYTGGDFCSAATIQFLSSASNTDSLQWDFGDGSTLTTTTSASVSHTYQNAGTYNPSLTLISMVGCEIHIPGNDTIRIEKLQAGFNYTMQQSCGLTTLNLIDTTTSLFGIMSSSWDFGNGGSGTGAQVQQPYTTPGNYEITLAVMGNAGCVDTLTVPVNIAVNQNPTVSINGPAVVCPDVITEFAVQPGSPEPLTNFEWTSVNAPQGSNGTYEVTLSEAGLQDIQLIAGTAAGCYDTAHHSITVKPAPVLQQPINVQVCNGARVDGIDFLSDMPGSNYSWTNSDPGIGLQPNGTDSINSFIAINTTSTPVIATLTVTANADGCVGISKTFSVTILPSPLPVNVGDQVLCNREVSTQVIFNSLTAAVAATSFTWTNPNTSIGLGASGVGNIPAFAAVNNGNNPVTASITVVPTLDGCAGSPQTFDFIINPTPVVFQNGNINLCNGETSAIQNFNSSISNSNYTWSNDQSGIGLPASGMGHLPAFTAINNTGLPQVANVNVTAEAFGCNSDPITFPITVNPTPSVAEPADQAVCTGTATSLVAFFGSVPGTIYHWSNNASSIGLGASGTGDILSFNPANSSNSNVVATIRVLPVFNGCTGAGTDFTITVQPSPNLVQPLNQFQCNGETTVPVNPVSNTGGTTFTWSNSLPSIGLAANGNGGIPSFTTSNNGNVALTATITITPSSTSCTGVPKSFDIIVDPTPSILQPGDQTLCSGETVNAINFQGNVAGTQFSWINSVTNIGLAASGTGNIAPFTALNNTGLAISSLIQVTATANSCNSNVKFFTISVHPTPVIDAVADQSICNGMLTNPIALTGPVTGTVYTWQNDRPDIGLAPNGTGDVPAFTARNNTAQPIIAHVIVFGNNTYCNMAIDSFDFTIQPTPSVNAGADIKVCFGAGVQLTATATSAVSWSPQTGLSCVNCLNPIASPADSTLYQITATNMAGCTSKDSILLMVQKPFSISVGPEVGVCPGNPVQLSARNASNYSWTPADGLSSVTIASPVAAPATTRQYTVIGKDAYGCFSDTASVTVTVHPKPQVEIGPELTVSPGSSVQLTPVISNGPVASYSWEPSAGLSCSNCESPMMQVNKNSMYALTVVTPYGCSAVDSIFVRTFCQKAEVFVPNAFTPDGDGLNDLLMIRGSGITVKSFRVFNRWGNLVFERQNFAANDPKNAWDGKIRSVPAAPDVYIYTAEVICDNGTVYTYKGNTTIIK